MRERPASRPPTVAMDDVEQRRGTIRGALDGQNAWTQESTGDAWARGRSEAVEAKAPGNVVGQVARLASRARELVTELEALRLALAANSRSGER